MIVGLFIAVVLVLMLAFTLLDIWTAAPSTPNYGLHLVEEDRGHLDDAPVEGCDCEDCTEVDPMDAYLEQRAAGNGVLPAEPERFRPHTECVNRWADGEPHRVHARCREAIEAGVPQ